MERKRKYDGGLWANDDWEYGLRRLKEGRFFKTLPKVVLHVADVQKLRDQLELERQEEDERISMATEEVVWEMFPELRQ